MVKKYFLRALSKAMNTYLHLDPESTQRLHKLADKAITIELLPFHLKFQCVFTETEVKIYSDAEIETETNIRGTPLQMMGIMLNKTDRLRFFADDIQIEGNAEFAQQVIHLFDELQIDWEELLSKATGDIPAFRISQTLKGLGKWLRDAENSFNQNINEYVHEEAEWLPTKEALQDFFHDVDVLRMDVDRIEAKINQLNKDAQ